MRIQILAALTMAVSPAIAEARDGASHVRVMRGSDAGTSWEASRERHGVRAEHRVGHSGDFNRYPGYRSIRRGGMVPGYWASPRYGISNHGMYGFDRPAGGSRWVRYYDDALLVDHAGRVQDGRYGMDFDRYGEGWEHDERGVPVYGGDHDYDDREYSWSDRFERDDHGDLDYDRDYPYEHPYGGYGQAQSGYGYGHGAGGYTVTETTVTTGPSVVHYIDKAQGVAVHRQKRMVKRKRGYRSGKSAYRATAVPRCVC